jgi:hypothetical protein
MPIIRVAGATRLSNNGNTRHTWFSSQSAAGTPTTELRVAYLDSRARIVGDKGLFTTVNFDSSCDADNNELEAIVTTMETKSNIQALIDPILRQKSYTNQNVTPKQCDH